MGNANANGISLGYAKESVAFGTFAVPAFFPKPEAWSPSPKNVGIKRPASAKRPGQAYMATGPYEFAASLRPSPEPDTLFPLLAYFFGAQTAPAPYTYVSLALTSGSAVGAGTVLNVTAGAGNAIQIGDNVVLGFGTANVETVVVTAHAANTITATTTKTHANGDLVQAQSPLAFQSILSFSLLSIPSLSFEYNRVNDADDYLGCKLDTLKVAIAPGQSLACDFGIVGQTSVLNASPTAPSFGSLAPLVNEAVGTTVAYNGTGIAPGATTLVKKFDLNVNNNLEKNFRTAGSRLVQDFPLGQRVGSGSVVLSFPDSTKYKDFLGASTASGPSPTIAGVNLVYTIAGASLADPTRLVPYSVAFSMPNMFLNGNAVPGKLQGSLEQTLSFDLAETAGNGDDLKATIIGVASTVY